MLKLKIDLALFPLGATVSGVTRKSSSGGILKNKNKKKKSQLSIFGVDTNDKSKYI